MSDYLLFVLIASVTIASPGPGVVCTLSNAVRLGYRRAMPGIAGLAFASLVVAGIAATGLGLLLVNSTVLFTLLKLAGALYLISVGIRLWFKTASPDLDAKNIVAAQGSLFCHAALIQLLNPKAVLFFAAVFPQFIDRPEAIVTRFVIFIATYCALIVVIHSVYALLANSVRRSLATPTGSRMTSRAAGTGYVLFGAGLASTLR